MEQFNFYVVRFKDGTGWYGDKGREYSVHNAKQYVTRRNAEKVVEKYPTLPLEVVEFIATEQAT